VFEVVNVGSEEGAGTCEIAARGSPSSFSDEHSSTVTIDAVAPGESREVVVEYRQASDGRFAAPDLICGPALQ
jgi:hypothetical protein